MEPSLQTVNKMEQSELKIYFEISQGEQNKMYTLWRITESAIKYNRIFVQNLSIDKEQALAKAKELTNGAEIIDDSLDKLRKIVRSDSGLVSFGKYLGEPIISLPDGYLQWLAQGGPIESEVREYGENVTYTKYLASEYEKKVAIEEATKRGLLVEFEGAFISVKYRDFILDSRKGWGHHFTAGEKIQRSVQCVSLTGFQNDFGYTNIYTFKDIETGNKYQYMGGVTLELKPTEVQKEQGLLYGDVIQKGDCFTLKGTVKLGEYKDQKITYLQRIKIV